MPEKTDWTEKAEANRNWLRSLWPQITDLKTARDAAKGSGIAAWYLAISGAVLAAIALWSGEPRSAEDFYTTLIGYTVIIIFYAVIGFYAYRGNRLWSVIILCIVLFEAVVKVMTSPGGGFVLSVIIALIAINGVRGSFAAKRYSAELHPTDETTTQ